MIVTKELRQKIDEEAKFFISLEKNVLNNAFNGDTEFLSDYLSTLKVSFIESVKRIITYHISDNLQSPDDLHKESINEKGEESAKPEELTEEWIHDTFLNQIQYVGEYAGSYKAAAAIYKGHREEIEKLEKENSDAKEEIASLCNQIKVRDEQIDKIIQNH